LTDAAPGKKKKGSSSSSSSSSSSGKGKGSSSSSSSSSSGRWVAGDRHPHHTRPGVAYWSTAGSGQPDTHVILYIAIWKLNFYYDITSRLLPFTFSARSMI
jgi:hypothetical protein